MALDQMDTRVQELLDSLGDLSGIEVLHNKVILATCIRPEKTKGGLYMTDTARKEDVWQSKCGLLILMGPQAFQQTGEWFQGVTFHLHDWLIFKPSDGWAMEINKVPCRMFDDVNIAGRVSHPDLIY